VCFFRYAPFMVQHWALEGYALEPLYS